MEESKQDSTAITKPVTDETDKTTTTKVDLKEVAEVKPTDKVHEETPDNPEQAEDDDSDGDEGEPTVLDALEDGSDSDEYSPPSRKNSEDEIEILEDDDDVSSGEEEVDFRVEETLLGESKFYKLKFKDVDQKQREYLDSLKDPEESQESELDPDKENKAENDDTVTATPKFMDYRSVLDQDMAEYKSDDDDDFNPVYCGETLSDVEYKTEDERDTESEVEVEETEDTHRKTGEALRCLRIKEKLEIPPDCAMEAAAIATANSPVDVQDSPMECV
uniref:Uncharacterized protein n=1 Tax=Ciona savignyi TaxID=51511 RepID=H2YYQ4_CIOSA